MTPFLLSLICLLLVVGFFGILLMKSHSEQVKQIQEMMEKNRQDQKELTNKLVTMLGTKDPLAYQAVEFANQSLTGTDVILGSDEAEAARIQAIYEQQGLAGYGEYTD